MPYHEVVGMGTAPKSREVHAQHLRLRLCCPGAAARAGPRRGAGQRPRPRSVPRHPAADHRCCTEAQHLLLSTPSCDIRHTANEDQEAHSRLEHLAHSVGKLHAQVQWAQDYCLSPLAGSSTAHLPSASCPFAAVCSPLGAAYAERRRCEPPSVGAPPPAPPSGARLRRLMLCSDRAWRQLLLNT